MDELKDKILQAISTNSKLKQKESKEFYKNSILKSIHFVEIPIEDNSIQKGLSKVGGNPDLPIGIEWPRFNDEPMTFISQFNLNDIFNVHGYSLLPPKGLISIFMYNNEDGFWTAFDAIKIIYSNDLENLRRLSFPLDFASNKIIDASIMKFYKTYSIPSFYDSRILALDKDDRESNIEEEIDTITESFYKDIKLFNQIFGYPRSFNGSVLGGDWAARDLKIEKMMHVRERYKEIQDHFLNFKILIQHDFCVSASKLSKFGGCPVFSLGLHIKDLESLNFSKTYISFSDT